MKPTQLQNVLIKYLSNAGYQKIQYTNNFIIAEGELPICLIAHMDTVFNNLPQEFFYDSKKKVLWSNHGSGFDDRAGIYGIIQCIEDDLKPHIIFTQGEERGGIGAKALINLLPFCPFSDCRALIELDRANERDSVFYDCDNRDFEKWINSFGFKTDYGTFSDISIIAPEWKIAAVNLSIGYADEHTYAERLYCEWCDKTIETVKKILKASSNMLSYDYVPIKYDTKYWSQSYDNNFYGSPVEDDNFDNEYDVSKMKYCLLCNTHLNDNNKHIIPDKNYPYVVCDTCFNNYYDSEAIYKGGYMNSKEEFNLPFE